MLDPPNKLVLTLKKIGPFLFISVRFGIGATIRIGQEIQCLPYAGFFLNILFMTIEILFVSYFQDSVYIKKLI